MLHWSHYKVRLHGYIAINGIIVGLAQISPIGIRQCGCVVQSLKDTPTSALFLSARSEGIVADVNGKVRLFAFERHVRQRLISSGYCQRRSPGRVYTRAADGADKSKRKASIMPRKHQS